MGDAPAIRLAGLTKYYGTSPGILDVDLEVARGEVFGFVGPNGAGKSTTMRILLDFHRATAGTATLLGLDSRRDSKAIRARCGYLAGDIALYERLTARRHLDWQNRLRGGAMRDIDGWADRLGLDLDRPIADLSKGNRQKVGLVQAFAHEPDLLVLDEPTSGLDPLVQQEFHAMVSEVVEAGRTVFLSSHVIGEIDQTCERVGIIRDGRIVAVEDIDTMKGRSVREVEIRFADPIDPAPYLALEGVSEVSHDGDTIRLVLGGSPDALIKLAARSEVVDLSMTAADLASSILGFYGSEPTRSAGPDRLDDPGTGGDDAP
ncbi:MAG: ABC transporter ATP-binding protein [Ilumatobacteraceae bacterium]